MLEILLDEMKMKLQGSRKKALNEPKTPISRTYFNQIMLKKLGSQCNVSDNQATRNTKEVHLIKSILVLRTTSS